MSKGVSPVYIDLKGFVPNEPNGIEYYRAVLLGGPDSPFCTVFYSLNGVRKKYGLRLDLDKRSFADEGGSRRAADLICTMVASHVAAEKISRVVKERKVFKGEQEVPAGIYRHFKGNHYEVIGVAIHTETKEELVAYRALYGNFLFFVRPKKMFLETIKRRGYSGPRFALIRKFENK